jgi:hypothetical protein
MSNDSDLLKFVSSVSGDTFLKVEEDLGDGFVRLKISEAERRQAKHDIRCVEDVVVELLRNSRDAHAHRIFVATGREGDVRTITVVDDGVGVPDTLREKIFEPRVTSKLETMVVDEWGVHGRGMALFSIRSNVTEAEIVATGSHKGAAMRIVADVTALTERADQSTWPALEKDEAGTPRVARGPHNIVRRVVEFSVEHPGIELFYGSPTEIVATMVLLARFELEESDLVAVGDLKRLPLWLRPGAAVDAGELADAAAELGLPISERSAHRILAGDIVPLRPVSAHVSRNTSQSVAEPGVDIYRDRRGLKIHHTDLDAFRSDLEAAFDRIADKYYVHLAKEPKITVSTNDIRVRFEIDKED